MNIDKMSDEQKSVMLAKLCGWSFFEHMQYYYYLLVDAYDNELAYLPDYYNEFENDGNGRPNLYDPANMSLAWKCIEWVTAPPKTLKMSEAALNTKFGYWWQGNAMWAETAADAQRAWLDKILSLAVEAGMVEEAK